jgi:hypothetical protein
MCILRLKEITMFYGRGTDRRGAITRFDRNGTMSLMIATWVDGKLDGEISEESNDGWNIATYRYEVKRLQYLNT